MARRSSTRPGSRSRTCELVDKRIDFEAWLERTGCVGRGPGASASCSPTGSPTAGSASTRASQGPEALMAIIVDRDTRLVVQGLTGARGLVPRPAQPRLRDAGRRRRHARQGRPGRRGHPGLRHGRGRRRRDRREHDDGLRPGALRRRTRSTRRSTPASARSSASPRACPRTRCCASTTTSGRKGITMLGPNCPGALSPGKANVGIIPAEIFREGRSASSRAPARSRTRSATS